MTTQYIYVCTHTHILNIQDHWAAPRIYIFISIFFKQGASNKAHARHTHGTQKEHARHTQGTRKAHPRASSFH